MQVNIKSANRDLQWTIPSSPTVNVVCGYHDSGKTLLCNGIRYAQGVSQGIDSGVEGLSVSLQHEGEEWSTDPLSTCPPGIAQWLANARVLDPWIGAGDKILRIIDAVVQVLFVPPGGVAFFDGFGDGLHPHMIRVFLADMACKAEQNESTVVLTTHNPVVLNEFQDRPDQVFVFSSTNGPAPLTELVPPTHTALFELGQLYDREKFGGLL